LSQTLESGKQPDTTLIDPQWAHNWTHSGLRDQEPGTNSNQRESLLLTDRFFSKFAYLGD